MINILILLKNKNKIFCSYSERILFEFSDELLENRVTEFIKNEYSLNSLKSEIIQLLPGLSIVEINLCDESYKGEFVSLSRALKLLEKPNYNNAIKDYFESQKLKSDIKLKYGLRDNNVICIGDIRESEKGLKCNCYCPGCGLPLQAKLGHGKKQPHFSHNNAACDTVIAQQTALHLLAKEIIENEKEFCFPPIIVGIDEISENIVNRESWYALPKSLVYKESITIKCDTVMLERQISNIVPDIIIEKNGRKCLVEIAVTHFIDEYKAEKIEQLGLPVLEIDLSSLRGLEISREELRKILVNDFEFKKWIFNPRKKDAIEWANGEYKLRQREYDKKKLKEQEELQKYRSKKAFEEQQKEIRREKAESIIKQLQKPENYHAAVLKLRNDEEYRKALKKRKFYKDYVNEPFFFDIPITGEMVFECDRRIWQSAIFDKFVYNRNESIIKTRRIFSWATKHQDEFRINWDLIPKTSLRIKNQERFVSLLHECIKQYIEYLSFIGFVSPVFYGESTVESKHNINPPNKEKAAELKNAIFSINQYSWNVTDQIYAILFSHRANTRTWEKTLNYNTKSISAESSNIQEDKRISAYKIMYDNGMEEVINNNLFDNNEIIKDSYGKRWLICSSCGQIKREDEMVSYQGKTGLCRECEKNIK